MGRMRNSLSDESVENVILNRSLQLLFTTKHSTALMGPGLSWRLPCRSICSRLRTQKSRMGLGCFLLNCRETNKLEYLSCDRLSGRLFF